jgi:hypothetical protein
LPAALAVVVSIVMTWPLVLHLGTDVPQDLGDPLFDSWQVAWMGHALLHQPLHLFQANRFWPEHDSLAFTDVTIGYTPAGIVAAQGTQAALIVHNLLFIFAYALAFLGAYLLACELGAGLLGGTVAGAAYAYAPWHLAHNGHLQVTSSGGIPLALFLLVRGYRRGSGRTILAGWLVAAWQLTLGFTYGIPMTYLLFVLAVVVGGLWLHRGRPTPPRALVYASVVGVCAYALVGALQARPYLRVIDDHPEAKRTTAEVAFFSPPPRAFLAAPGESWLWGGATADKRNSLRAPVEESLFPGVTVLLLALLGLASAAYPRGIRIGLAVGVVAWGVLSLGLPHYPDGDRGFTPYRLLYEIAPGWSGMRTPGRLNAFTSLGLALLAGAGLALVLRNVRSLSIIRPPSRRAAAALVAAGCLTGLVLLEGFGPIPHPRAPTVPPGQIGAEGPQLNLPTDDLTDLRYAYWSVAGFPKIANGGGSFDPVSLVQLRQAATNFPDAGSVAYLRALGIRTVILHPELASGTPWQDAAGKPTAGLPLTREDKDGVVLYHLDPAPG